MVESGGRFRYYVYRIIVSARVGDASTVPMIAGYRAER